MREILSWCLVASLCGLVGWFRKRAFAAEDLNYAMRGTLAAAEGVERELGHALTRAAEMEADRDYWRSVAGWEHGQRIDPRIANAPLEKIRSIYRDLFAPVRPSPLDAGLHVDAPDDAKAAALLLSRVGGFTGEKRT